MLSQVITQSPAVEEFTLLDQHQSQTPESFHHGKPVLHHLARGAKAITQRVKVHRLPFFPSPDTNGSGEQAATAGAGDVVAEVDVYITSTYLTIFNTEMQKGLSIPYPSIGLHAIQTVSDEHNPDGSKGLFLQLELPDPAASQEIDDDEPETIELTLIPARPEETISTNDSSPPPKTPIQNMYEALTACSNLNPSPNLDDADDDEDPWANDRIVLESEAEQQGIAGLPGVLRGRTDGALPAPFPGSGGWITAENVGEYFDDDGNWLGREDDDAAGDALGDGAGRVRSRGEFDAADTSADPETTEDGDREGDGKRRRPDTEI